MDYVLNADAQRRLGEYFGLIGEVLANKKRRASFAVYALGLLSEAERKSMEPLAVRGCADVTTADASHQRLHHFISNSAWCDRDVRRASARYAVAAMSEREPVETWIVDDTGFLKQGKHSVGVQRQYTGSAGKVANCQIGVSLSVATRTEQLPIDFELYLPRTWIEDVERRREARIPDDTGFKTKPELALDMIRRAIADGIPRGVVLADAAYGTSTEFRESLRWMGLDYAVAVEPQIKVWKLDRANRRHGDKVEVRQLARELEPARFQRVTWRQGTRAAMSARFATMRVVTAHEDGWSPAEREDVWLIMEWPDGESLPGKYHLTSLPRSWTRKRLVRTLKERWRTERVYEDLKGELGLDHFEGRRLTGWNHHVSVALCCYAFVVAERVRRFPPSARRQSSTDSHASAA